MADKVKLTPPMTDSKTTDWAAEASRIAMDIVPKMALTFDHSHGLKDYDERKAAELPFRQIAQHDITPAISQALLSAYERGRKEGIEEAAKVAANAEMRSLNDKGGTKPILGRSIIAAAIRNLKGKQ